MGFIARFLLNILILLVISEYLPGVFVEDIYGATIAVVVLGILNTLIKPVLIILTLPISIITLGLFTFVINAGLFMFAASFLDGLDVTGFWPALLASLILSVGNMVGSRILS